MSNGVKQTEIGEIPEDWQIVKLKQISHRIKNKNDGSEKEILTISAKSGFVRQADRYSRYMAGKSVENYVLLKQGQFSYNKGNSLTYPYGCIYRLDTFSQAFVPNVYISFELNSNANSEFCKHLFLQGDFISRLKKYITSGVRGNGLLNVNPDDFFSLQLALPPLAEQQKIAEILSMVDEKMAVIDEQLTKTTELKVGLMQRLLTKGIGHTTFKDSPLGEIPESWEVVRFEELLQEKNSLSYGILQPGEGVEDGVPMLRTVDLSENGLAKTKILKVPHEISAQFAKTVLKGGEILFSVMGTLGRTVVVLDSWKGWNVNRALAVIRVNDKISKHFFCHILRSATFQSHIIKQSLGSAQMRINLGDLRTYWIQIPPLSEQHQIADLIDAVDEKIQVLRDKKEQYQTLKRGLMQQLLTGKLRVRITEDVIPA